MPLATIFDHLLWCGSLLLLLSWLQKRRWSMDDLWFVAALGFFALCLYYAR